MSIQENETTGIYYSTNTFDKFCCYIIILLYEKAQHICNSISVIELIIKRAVKLFWIYMYERPLVNAQFFT